MEMTGKYKYEADQESVWRLLMAPDAIAEAIPGVDRMTPLDSEANAWRATAKIGIASVSGTVRMNDIEAPSQYRLMVSGEGKQSIIGGSAQLKLSYDTQKQRTIQTWFVDAKISGKLASVGLRLIATVLLSKLFFRALARQLPNYNEEEGGESDTTT